MAQTLELNITGMTCEHCVKSVTNALKEVPGVADARVNLETNSAVVEGENFDTNALIAAVEEEGYEAVTK
ncbi:MAG: heavy metal-associated domain-containing protein [Tepidiformaceae bacterium]